MKIYLENNKKKIGQIEWAFWIDLECCKKALIINEKTKEISKALLTYFEQVKNIQIKDEKEFKRFVYNATIKDEYYDLIHCTFLFNSIEKKKSHELLDLLSSLLKPKGIVITGYGRTNKLIRGIVRRSFLGKKNQYEDDKGVVKGMAKRSLRFVLKKENLILKKILYVFPDVEKPWTLSDSPIMLRKIKDWKSVTKRNFILVYIMASPIISWSIKFWWPYRLIILEKN